MVIESRPEAVTSLASVVERLLQAVAWRAGLITESYAECGPTTDSAGTRRQEFRDLVQGMIAELVAEFGPTCEERDARAFGIAPESILGPPRLNGATSRIEAFATWRHKDLWLFIVGRYCAADALVHYVIVVGAISQTVSAAQIA